MKLPPWLRTAIAAFAHDMAMVPLAWLGAFWLRFNLGAVPEPFLRQALLALPIVVAVQGAAFYFFGLYRGVWRFASLPDLVRIVKAVAVGVAATAVLLFLVFRLQWIPRSIFPLYGLVLLLALGGPRFVYRLSRDRGLYLGTGERVLIVGAGRAGEMLARELARDPRRQHIPIAFVDDDRSKRASDVHGVRVVGGCDRIPELVEQLEIDLIFLAVPSATQAEMRRLVELCERAGVEFRTLPRMADLTAAPAIVETLREVSLEDLLGRKPIGPHWDELRAGITGRRVLVTGGGGSIGAELCRQIARLRPALLVVVESSEYNLYALERGLRESSPELAFFPVLGDVTDRATIDRLFGGHRPELVFHAAAYKHVPLLERQVREAVHNNVLGTQRIAEAVLRHGAATFVLISTDKAVNPRNVLGATKRAAELVCQACNGRSSSRFVTVRFGNVLGSAGSVVPLFEQQIASGGPVTVTDPQVTRYFMTIPEAGQLILQAAVMAQGGETYVLDMGDPVRIAYLAEQLIRLMGKEPGRDVQIVFTGLRPGEKLHEELFHTREGVCATRHEKILLARGQPCSEAHLAAVLEAMAVATSEYDEAELSALLARLVPSFFSGAPLAPAAREEVVPLRSTAR